MAPNFPNLMTCINSAFQKAQMPHSINSKRTMRRHMIVKLLKISGTECVFLKETHCIEGNIDLNDIGLLF